MNTTTATAIFTDHHASRPISSTGPITSHPIGPIDTEPRDEIRMIGSVSPGHTGREA